MEQGLISCSFFIFYKIECLYQNNIKKSQSEMNITIKNTEVTLKYSFRSHLLYEEIIGETFAPTSTKNLITFFYCVVLASAKNLDDLTFDNFLDWLDENPSMLTEFTVWLNDVINAQKVVDKKKATRAKTKSK